MLYQVVCGGYFQLIICITEWSDDCDPNNVKRNKKSIWVKTITLLTPRHLANSTRYTFPIAIGTKGSDHSVVEDIFNREIQELAKAPVPMYVTSVRRVVPVNIVLALSIQDRPERSAVTGIGAHNGSYTALWVVLAKLSQTVRNATGSTSVSSVAGISHWRRPEHLRGSTSASSVATGTCSDTTNIYYFLLSMANLSPSLCLIRPTIPPRLPKLATITTRTQIC